MREIKFRVWFYDGQDLKTGRMTSLGEALQECFVGTYADDDRLLGPFDECSILMQYTGLKDKNGVEIYEGDVVNVLADYQHKRSMRQRTSRVFYLDRSAAFFLDFGPGVVGRIPMRLSGYGFHETGEPENIMVRAGRRIMRLDRAEVEVIGNIYDNPDILNSEAGV